MEIYGDIEIYIPSVMKNACQGPEKGKRMFDAFPSCVLEKSKKSNTSFKRCCGKAGPSQLWGTPVRTGSTLICLVTSHGDAGPYVG